jgi:adenylosuccinate lyase
MAAVFSNQRKFETWRRLWVALAESLHALGVPSVKPEQIASLRAHLTDIPFDRVRAIERDLRHDVMSHVHAWGEQVGDDARKIIHLGATSAFVSDNGDLVQYRQGLDLIQARLARLIETLCDQRVKWKDLPVLGWTHYQPAQPTTLGKRITLWIYDLLLDLADVRDVRARLPLRGAKGATGTQATFQTLFRGAGFSEGDTHAKCIALETLIAGKLGFASSVPVAGQTYTRKWDTQLLRPLVGVAESLSKFGNDMRLMQHSGEVMEPFEDKQIGSSAMAYKQNPMRSERICSLARLLIQTAPVATYTAATQWFERTLDDSAGRRVAIPESFLTADAILILATNVSSALRVFPARCAAVLGAELPFMATEELIMRGVARGHDRQDLHEVLRVASIDVRRRIFEEGADAAEFFTLLRKSDRFAWLDDAAVDDLRASAIRLTGRAVEQVDEFVPTARAAAAEARADVPAVTEGEVTV